MNFNLVVSAFAVFSTLSTASLAQDAIGQLDIQRIPDQSIRNPFFAPAPLDPARPNEVLDLLSAPDQISPDLLETLTDPSQPSLDMIDRAIRDFAAAPDPALQGALISVAERLGATPDEWLRRGIIEQFLGQDDTAAAGSFLKSAESGNAWGALFSGRSYLGGIGAQKDIDLAIGLLKNAEFGGVPEVEVLAKIELARVYSGYYGAPSDMGLAEQYYQQAVELSPMAIPDYIDFRLNDLGDDPYGDEIQPLISILADAGNASALYQEYLQFGDRDEIMSRLLENPSVGAAIVRGEIFLLEGDEASAFSAFAGVAGLDPYARAQVGLLALDNPNLGMSTEQALGLVQDSSELGEPLATLELTQRSEDPEDRFIGAIQAQEQDPSGKYTEAIRGIKSEVCAVNQDDCAPVPVWFITNRLQTEGDRLQYANRIGGGLTAGMTETLILTVQQQEPESRGLLRRAYCFLPLTCRDEQVELENGVPVISPMDATVDEFIDELKYSADEAGADQIIVYIHGFNNSFDAAVDRLALLADRGQLEAVPLVLSWASGGETFIVTDESGTVHDAYRYDLGVAQRSCDEFRNVLSVVIDAFGPQNVHVLAHSMGTYLVDMIVSGCTDPATELAADSMKSVIFAAADIDREDFGNHYDDFRARTENFSLYVTANDAALKLSTDIVHHKDRLGQGGSGRFVRDDSTTLDSTALESDGVNHAHVFDVPEVRRDVALVLHGEYGTGSPRCLVRHESGAYLLWKDAC